MDVLGWVIGGLILLVLWWAGVTAWWRWRMARRERLMRAATWHEQSRMLRGFPGALLLTVLLAFAHSASAQGARLAEGWVVLIGDPQSAMPATLLPVVYESADRCALESGRASTMAAVKREDRLSPPWLCIPLEAVPGNLTMPPGRFRFLWMKASGREWQN